MKEQMFSKHISLSSRSRVEMQLWGSRILLIRIDGILSKELVDQYIHERNRFIDEVGLRGQFFVEIHDLSRVSKVYYRTFYRNMEAEMVLPEEYKSKAYFILNPPMILKIFKLLWRNNPEDTFFSGYSRNFREAFLKGMNILYESGVFSFTERNRIPNREWCIENPLYRESIQLISENIIYVEARGRLSKEEEYRRREHWMEMIASLPSFPNGFRLLLGLKEDFLEEDIEKILSPQWQKLLIEKHCVKLIVLTNQDKTAVAVNQLLTLSNISFRIERRFSEALVRLLPKVHSSWGRFRKKGKTDNSSGELDKLESYILNLDMSKKSNFQLVSSEMLNDMDPLRPIYQSVNLFFTQAQDEYSQLYSRWEELLRRNKEAQLQRGLYELLYRDRFSSPNINHTIEEFTQVINETMDNCRTSCFFPKDGAFYCTASAEKQRPSLKGSIFPSSIIEFLSRSENREFFLSHFNEKMNREEKLTLGPFLRSFLNSQGIARLFLIPLLDEENPCAYMMMDFKKENSREAEYIYHLINQQLYLIKGHFKVNEQPTAEPVSLEEALAEYDDDQEFFVGVLGNFIASLDSQWNLITQAVEDKTHDSIRRECHKIKGGAANLFSRDLQEASRQMEEAAENERDGEYSVLLKNLKSEGERLKHWYQARWP